ncbi:MAG TPA: trehalose-phosphatase [Actinomycetota bacterium]
MSSPSLPLDRVGAVVFDMDGVITDTASVHAAAWKRLFDEYLAARSRRSGEPFEPFDVDADYRRYIDGKPRYDGVRDLLTSRGITLPDGDPSDPPDRETVCGLGNRKNEFFLEHLRSEGAEPYPSTVELIRRLHELGVGVAVISASQNAQEVLDAAGVGTLFDVRVDGAVADDLGLPGKPDPAVFVEAARRLGAAPDRTAIVEDSIAGVEAGRRGAFALVVGVDRAGHADALRRAGADVVVADLAELGLVPPGGRDVQDLPLALDRAEEIEGLLAGRRPAVFLDYDGTLTPIVDRPEDALLAPETRAVIEGLAARCPVAVVSGRDLANVRGLVGIEGIVYAGSHGFDILGGDGESQQRGREFLPDLDAAERELAPLLAGIEGARLERKAFAVTTHFRLVDPARAPEVEAAVDEVASRYPHLRRTGGKKVFELRPAVDWDKGKALLWLLEVLGLGGLEHLPVYVGDDETDEDAFRAIRDRGLGVVVRGEGDERPTDARYALRDPDEARGFLELLASIAGTGGP